MNDVLLSNLKKLREKKIPNPELDLRILLREASYEKKDFILSNVKIEDINVKYFDALVLKRLNREPISKIINSKYFWKTNFFVNTKVLDPRPESELIIEEVINNIENKSKKFNLLDIGTGSGCLAISIAKEFKNSKITAIDISREAIKVAKKNAEINNVSNQIIFKTVSFEKIKTKFDIIISNPPYINEKEYKVLDREVKNFEPKVALNGGKDGLSFYRFFAKNIEKNMKRNSFFICEIGHSQLFDCKKIFGNTNLILKKISKDIQKIDRTLTFYKI